MARDDDATTDDEQPMTDLEAEARREMEAELEHENDFMRARERP